MLTAFFRQHDPAALSRPSEGLGVLAVRDKELVRAHYLALDDAARRHRFGVALSNELLERWVDTLPFDQDSVLGYFEHDELVGLLYLVRDTRHANRGEAALSVRPSAQGRGIGKRLTRLALQVAAHAGMALVDIHYQGSNSAMTRITSRLPGTRQYWTNEIHVVVDIEKWAQAHATGEG